MNDRVVCPFCGAACSSRRCTCSHDCVASEDSRQRELERCFIHETGLDEAALSSNWPKTEVR